MEVLSPAGGIVGEAGGVEGPGVDGREVVEGLKTTG